MRSTNYDEIRILNYEFFGWFSFINILVHHQIHSNASNTQTLKLPNRPTSVSVSYTHLDVYKRQPLFLVLLIIEGTDLIFAVDSIPAIFSVTKDPYIVFFSNIFAIIGLRSMFFLLAGIIDKFRFLKIGLAVLLTFIGLKMLFHHYLEEWGFSTTHSLLIIVGILGASILFLSLIHI